VLCAKFPSGISFGDPLSLPPCPPSYLSKVGEGRLKLRRIIVAVATLAALVLGGGAGVSGI